MAENLFDILKKSEVGRSIKNIAEDMGDISREMVIDPMKHAGKLTKEGLIDTKDALVASGKVLGKTVKDFSDSLGLHLFEQGTASKTDRIAGVVTSLVFAAGMSAGFLPLASAVLHGPVAGTPEAYGIAALLTLPTSLPLAKAYAYAMGRARF